ncbi:MAG: hypothetical protein QXD51_03180, partial [Candidatus Anstonellales archaeon]
KALESIINKKIDACEYSSALGIIRDSISVIMNFYRSRHDWTAEKERRRIIKMFDNLTREIEEKMNSLDKNELMEWAPPRKDGQGKSNAFKKMTV